VASASTVVSRHCLKLFEVLALAHAPAIYINVEECNVLSAQHVFTRH
jgi:hypothetical protein